MHEPKDVLFKMSDEDPMDEIIGSMRDQILEEADGMIDDLTRTFNVPARTFSLHDFEVMFLPMFTPDASD